MATIAHFVETIPLLDCALVHKFDHSWTVMLPLKDKKDKTFESPTLRTSIEGSFSITWQLKFCANESTGNYFEVQLLTIDNKEVGVYFSTYLLNFLDGEFRICLMDDYDFKYKSPITSWKVPIKDLRIPDAYNAKLAHMLKQSWVKRNFDSSFVDIPFSFQIEFKMVEMKPEVKYKLELARDFGTFRSEGQSFSDVTIIVKHSEFQVHKSIVGARSPVLERMISMKKRQEDRLKIEDFNPYVFELLLDFIYTGRVGYTDKDCATWLELLYTAEMFGVEELKKFCFDIIVSVFNIDFIARILNIADILDNDVLHIAAMNFVIRQEESVRKTPAFERVLMEHPFLIKKIKQSM